MTKPLSFRYFKTSPETIRLAVMNYIRFPLSLRNVEDLLHERGIEISHETVRYWWNRFGPMLAGEIRSKRVEARGNRDWFAFLCQHQHLTDVTQLGVSVASQLQINHLFLFAHIVID